MTAPEPRRFDIEVPGQPGTRVRVEVHHPDAGPIAVLSSGLGLPLELWHPVVRRLPEVRCVLFDRPGLGTSSDWAREPGLTGQVALIDAVRAAGTTGHRASPGSPAAATPGAPAAAEHPVVLVGHSYAGLHVEAYARRHPDRVLGLVLVDPSLPDYEAQAWTPVDLNPGLMRRLVSRAGWLGSPVRRLVALTGTAGTDPGDAVSESLREVSESARHQQGTIGELERIGAEAVELLAMEPGVPLPDIPVLLLAATRRPGPLPGRNRRWLAALARRATELGPRATLVEINGAHLLMADDPDEVAARIGQLAGPFPGPVAPMRARKRSNR